MTAWREKPHVKGNLFGAAFCFKFAAIILIEYLVKTFVYSIEQKKATENWQIFMKTIEDNRWSS